MQQTLAFFYIFLADLSPEHHPRAGLLIVTGKQPGGRKWDVLFGADPDLKINAYTTVKTSAWLKIPLTANGRKHICKKSPDAFHGVSAGKGPPFFPSVVHA